MIHALPRRAAAREGVGGRSFYNRGGGETAGACGGGRNCFHVELGMTGGDAREEEYVEHRSGLGGSNKWRLGDSHG